MPGISREESDEIRTGLKTFLNQLGAKYGVQLTEMSIGSSSYSKQIRVTFILDKATSHEPHATEPAAG